MSWLARLFFQFCALSLALALSAPSARAAAPPEHPTPLRSSAPTISVLTFGPGDETFSKFGHDAIWVRDPRQPQNLRDLVFNYGTFRFDSPWLILDFLKGKLSYWLSVGTLERTVAAYRAANRSVSAQELELSPERARAIAAFLHENVKPENAHYRYDYYRDNCATRIRDALDRHLDGQLRAASSAPAPMTYRDHTRRLTVGSPVLFLALDLALGPLIDRPITQWDEMFLPSRVEAKLSELQGEQGRPLVRQRHNLFESNRAPAPELPPGFRWGWLVLGASLGASLYLLSRLDRRWSQVGLALGLGALGLVAGILGALLLVLWLLTDHEVTHWNQNVLLCPLWALLMPLYTWDFARASPRRPGLMMRVVAASVVSAMFALFLRILLPASQHTGPALAYFLPLWLGAGLSVWERAGRPLPRWLTSRKKFADGELTPSPESSHP